MSGLSRLSAEQAIELDALRQLLARMSDSELRKFNQARSLRSLGGNFGESPGDVFVIQPSRR